MKESFEDVCDPGQSDFIVAVSGGKLLFFFAILT